MKAICIALVFSAFAVTSAHAASYIEMLNSNDGLTMIWIDNNFAHLSLAPKSRKQRTAGLHRREMLVDLKSRKMFIIDHKTKSLVEMRDMHAKQAAPPPGHHASISFERINHGPRVAGLSTQGYLVSADGRACYKVYASRQVLAYKQVVKYYKVMSEITRQDRESSDPCTAAEAAIESMDIDKYGLPVSMLQNNGKRLFEMKKISQGKSAPKNYLKMPGGYKIRSMKGMLKQRHP